MIVSPKMCSLAERTLVLIEQAENDSVLRERIVREGVANIAHGWGFQPVDYGCWPLW